ncbi:MAG: hypothetical protein LBF40_01015 [Deltaproteobacteria bacterium]|jgi:transposase|nr:hypothetical protein [Deltaproteobacteria bacterium]
MQRKASIELSPKERAKLDKLLEEKTLCAFKYRRALVVSLITQGYTDMECGKVASMSHSGVKKIRVRYRSVGFEGTINGKPKGHRPRALKPETEARLFSLSSERKINGKKLWTLKSLRAHVLEAEGIFLTLESIRRIIKRQAEEQMAA